MSNETKVSELETRSLTQIESAGLLPVSVPNVNTYAVPVNGITNAISAAQTAANNAQTAANSATSAASAAQVTANGAAGAASTAQATADSAASAAATAQTTANAAIPLSQRGVAGGVASLDAVGKVPAAQLPPIGGEVDPPDLVSGDATNALGIGQDGKLFVPTADAGGITDVKVNGSSVVSGSVANIVNMATTEDVSAAVTLAEEYTDTAIETVRSEIPDVSEFVKESNIIEVIEAHNESLSAHDDIRETLDDIHTEISTAVNAHDADKTAHIDMRVDISLLHDVFDDMETDVKALGKRIDGLESLGRWAGTFPTFDDVPTATSAFKHISENDFVYITEDENHNDLYSRYFVAEISDAGVITWGFDRSWSDTDISNKMDKVPTATTGNLIALDENGNAKDSEYKPADFVNNLVDQQLQVKLTFDDTITFNDIKVERISGAAPNAAINVSNMIVNEGGLEQFIHMNNGRIANLGDPVNSQDAANKRYVDSKTGGAGSILEEVEFPADFHYTDVKWRRIMTFTVPADDTGNSYNNLHGKLLITLKNSAAWPGGS